MTKKIDDELNKVINDIYKLRESIHEFPELGYEEYNTTETLEKFFNKYSIEFRKFKNITGGYVFIDSGKKDTIAFRSDIDALEILENTDIEFKSKNIGVMHACGHDLHISIASGIALILDNYKKKLKTNFIIIFQPAEECNPNGGAKYVIEERIIEKYNIKEFYGLHVWPSLKVGEIGIKDGPIMGSSDKLIISIKGKNAHAAEPFNGIDAISIGTDIVKFLKNNLRREIDPFETTVISIGEFNTKGSYNIICDEVEIRGTIRTINERIRKYLHKRIEDVVSNLTNIYGGKSEVTILRGYSSVINDLNLSKKFSVFSKEFLGENNVNTKIMPSLIAEDFSVYGKYMPSLFFFLGCESEYPLHNEKFNPKKETICQGIKLMANYFLANYFLGVEI